MSSQKIYNGNKMVPVHIKNEGTLATMGQAGGAIVDVLLGGVQGLIVNSFAGIAETITLTIDSTYSAVDIVLNDGRVYRTTTKLTNTARLYDGAIERANNRSWESEHIKEELIKSLKEGCQRDFKRHLTRIN